MWNMFEQPWALLITAGLLSIIIAILGMALPEKKKRRQWLLPLLFVILAFSLDFFVKTDLEKMRFSVDFDIVVVEDDDYIGFQGY